MFQRVVIMSVPESGIIMLQYSLSWCTTIVLRGRGRAIRVHKLNWMNWMEWKAMEWRHFALMPWNKLNWKAADSISQANLNEWTFLNSCELNLCPSQNNVKLNQAELILIWTSWTFWNWKPHELKWTNFPDKVVTRELNWNELVPNHFELWMRRLCKFTNSSGPGQGAAQSHHPQKSGEHAQGSSRCRGRGEDFLYDLSILTLKNSQISTAIDRNGDFLMLQRYSYTAVCHFYNTIWQGWWVSSGIPDPPGLRCPAPQAPAPATTPEYVCLGWSEMHKSLKEATGTEFFPLLVSRSFQNGA